MSKGLCNMTLSDRARAISRRLQGNERGLGYWAAIDAQKKIAAYRGGARKKKSRQT